MRILVLEDDERRMRWLRRFLPDARIVWARDVYWLIYASERERVWDLVLLDHDLGQPKTGTDAAKELWVLAPIVVWSLNPTGGPRMVRILEEREQNVVGWFPFGSPELAQKIRAVRRGEFGALAL